MTTKTPEQPTASLYRKLAAVAGAIEAVDKDGRNKDQGYRYPTPASVMSAVKPLLNEQKLAIVPHLVEFAEFDSGQRSGGGKPFVLNRVTMHYHILDGESGEALVVPWQAQAGTYGDDKGLAKAQTIALRTFLIQLFQIPAEDPETDPDARDARPSAERAQARPPARTAQNGGAGYHRPAEDLDRVDQMSAARRAQPTNGNDGQKRQLTNAELASAIRVLWQEERDLGGTTPAEELTLDLETLDRAQLVDLGKTARARLLVLQQQPRRMPEVDLPPITAAERATA